MLPIPDSSGKARHPKPGQQANPATNPRLRPVKTQAPPPRLKPEPAVQASAPAISMPFNPAARTALASGPARLRRESAEAATNATGMDMDMDAGAEPGEVDEGGRYSYDDDFSFGDGDAVILDDDGDESEEAPIIIEEDANPADESENTEDEPEEETIADNEPADNDSDDDDEPENDRPAGDDARDVDTAGHDADAGGGMGLASDSESDANIGKQTEDQPADAEDEDADKHAKSLFGEMSARKPPPGGSGGKVGGFKEKLAGFTDRLKSEIGDGGQADGRPPEPGQGLTAEPEEPDEQPETLKRRRGSRRSHHPLRKARDVFFKLSKARRRLYIISSIIACLLGVWTVPNLHAAFNPSSTSFEENEGTVKVADPKYADNHVSFKATNDSDMVAHISVKGTVKAWSPRPMWPSSLFAPRTIMGCGQTSMDINPGESKTITMECHGGDGIWKRPAIEVISG